MMAGIVPCANSDWRDAVKMGGIMKKMKKKKNVSRSEPEVLLNQVKQHKHVISHSVSTGATGTSETQ